CLSVVCPCSMPLLLDMLSFFYTNSRPSETYTLSLHDALPICALQRELPEPDVVDGLDALAPGVDLRLVDVTSRRRVHEEQSQRQPLIHVLRGLGVGVDDLLVADLVGILLVLEVVVVHERRRVV